MTQPFPIVKFIADLHFSHKPPLARAEADWYEIQENYWWQVVDTVDKELPICICGDIFDRSQPPLELVRFAINLFQSTNTKIYSVAGNHDLPNHNLDEMYRSAYGILVECDAVHDLYRWKNASIFDGTMTAKPTVNLYGFPCGCEVKPLENKLNGINVAIVHDYIWQGDRTGYSGAPESKLAAKRLDSFEGYDWVVTGDNHIPFHFGKVSNCGTLIRRKRDEIKYEPGVNILYSDNTIRRLPLDTSKDKFTDAQEIVQVMDNIGANTFVEELLALGDVALDFAVSIRRLLNKDKVTEEVKDFVLRCLERVEE